ncbi:MAG: histidine phosphatase family protein [Clostridia bacterium]|nr:histidine phosphatase family protein [Clostridia bacterium]
MTTVYFVRHAQPDHAWQDDRTRPLTQEGLADSHVVLEALRGKPIDVCYSSPYQRSRDTIAETAAHFGLEIHTDERLRERVKGKEGNNHGMFRLRWADHDFHEPGGESIRMVQERNVAALREILAENPGKGILVGTHGTALSSILNHYDPAFGCDDFLRIIDWMPYVIALTFDGQTLVGKEEICHVTKEFKGSARADKK